MSEFMPATPDKPSDQWSMDDVRRIFAGMTDGGVRVTYQHGELMDQPSEEVVEAGYFGPELTPKEHYDYLVERGCSVEEIEAIHNLRMNKDDTVSEVDDDDINEKEEAIYEI